MTLHLTRISNNYILQVSDRLVSGGVEDPLANKNVIYRARDAIVTIAYTGLAYGLSRSDRNTTTDEWIAEVLRGSPIPRGRDGVRPASLGFSKVSRWLDIGQSIQLLRDQLHESLLRLPVSRRKLPFELTVAGFQKDRRQRPRTIIASIVKPEGDAPIAIERLPRHWFLPGRVGFLHIPDGYVSDSEIDNLKIVLPKASPDDSENLLVNEILAVSSRFSTRVGQHCMSILIRPPSAATIRVRFIPSCVQTAVFQSKAKNFKHPVGFSPWIVDPNMFHAPSIMVGGTQFGMGPFDIVVEAPKPETSMKGYMGAVSRPPG